jgi:25S rRNA (adenine2142-N1)-methyltransferase
MPKPKRKRPVPLAPTPIMKSRKKARQVTTLFHKHTRERDLALANGDPQQVQRCDELLEEMGGREEYQRASQLSTSFHSTSKWVLGSLARKGWLLGIPIEKSDEDDINGDTASKKKNCKKQRRPTRLLEVGAINTELLDAAEQMVTTPIAVAPSSTSGGVSNEQKKYRLNVRAIDIHSMDKERIEEADFLTLKLISPHVLERYDVIVCSMVLNCVTTPSDRGKMLARLYHHLRPGGWLFLTIPLFCLTKSAFLTLPIFTELLGSGGVGFVVEETKHTPRVAFFVCQRPQEELKETLDKKWRKQTIRNKGKKFPNQFSVVLDEDEVFGRVEI